MEPPEKTAGVNKALGDLVENLQLVIDQVKDGENTRTHEPNFDLDGFWNRLGMTFKAVSTEATKLTMAFSSPPRPDAKEAQPLISGIEKSTLSLLSVFYSLPIEAGKTLHNKLHRMVITILTSVQSLANIIKTEGFEGSKHQLQSTGGVWEHCDSFPQLPKNNKDAVLFSARQNIELVGDALDEISSAVTEEPEDHSSQSSEETDSWTENDKKILSPALGLIKAARSCMKKVTIALRNNGHSNTQEQIKELDELHEVLEQVSPFVDDFVLSLYPPLRKEAVGEESQQLADGLLSLLKKAMSTHITTEADSDWLEFLSKAVHHNLGKLKELLS